MKKIKQYFKVWWMPIVGYSVPILIFIIGNLCKSDLIIYISFLVLLLNIFCNLISSYVQATMKKWFLRFLQIFVSLSLLLLLSLILMSDKSTNYGEQNYQIEDVIEYKR